MRFEMKCDLWIVALVGLAFFGSLAAGVVLAFSEPLVGALTALPVLVLAVVLRLIAWPVHYEVSDRGVAIAAGIQRLSIPFENLLRGAPSRSPLSSTAAWSLDRVRLDYKDHRGKEQWILISPVDKMAFFAAIAEKSPRHALQGGSLALKGEGS